MERLNGWYGTYNGPWWLGRFGWFQRILEGISGKDNVSKAYLKYEETDSIFWYVVWNKVEGERLKLIDEIPWKPSRVV